VCESQSLPNSKVGGGDVDSVGVGSGSGDDEDKGDDDDIGSISRGEEDVALLQVLQVLAGSIVVGDGDITGLARGGKEAGVVGSAIVEREKER